MSYVEKQNLMEDVGKAIHAANEILSKSEKLNEENSAKIDKIAESSAALIERIQKIELQNENAEYKRLQDKINSPDYEKMSFSGNREDHYLECKSFFDPKSNLTPRPDSPVRQVEIFNDFSQQWIKREFKGLDAVSYDNLSSTVEQYFPKASNIEKKKILNNLVTDNIIERKSYLISSNPSGGYMLRPEFNDWFVLKAWEINEVRSFCTTRTTSSLLNIAVIRDDNTIYSRWGNETTLRAQTPTPQIGLLRMKLDNIFIKPGYSEEFWNFATTGAMDVETFMMEYARKDILMNEAYSMINGDGNASVLGILAYPSWTGNGPSNYQRGALERVNTAGAGIVYDDVVNLMTSLNNQYSSNAAFYCNRFTWGELLKIKSTTGFPLINPNALGEGAPSKMLNYPLRILNQMPNIASGSQPLMFGDLKASYLIYDYPVVTMFKDIYTQVPISSIYISKFVGSSVTAFDGIKILQMI